METTTDQYAERAASIQTDLRRHADAIYSNRDLTADAKTRQVDALHANAKEQMDALREANEQANRTEASTLRRQLFGLPAGGTDQTTIISYRDAQERAARLTTDGGEGKAADLIDQALLSGDRILASAIAQRAIDLGFANVVNRWIEEDQANGPRLERLWELTDNRINTAWFAAESRFHVFRPADDGQQARTARAYDNYGN